MSESPLRPAPNRAIQQATASTSSDNEVIAVLEKDNDQNRSLDSLPRIDPLQQCFSAPAIQFLKREDFVENIIIENENKNINNNNNNNNVNENEVNHIDDELSHKTYTVVENDTLQSIALRFDLSVNWLSKQNKLITDNIFPGDILNVDPPPAETDSLDPIQCSKMSSDFTIPSIPGKLYLLDYTLNFQPDGRIEKPLYIDLIGHLESVILPHPTVMSSDSPDLSLPDTPMIYMVSYLEDTSNESSMEAAYFGTTLAIATKLKKIIEKIALKAQRTKGYIAPAPDSVPVQRDDNPIKSFPFSLTSTFRSILRIPSLVGNSDPMTANSDPDHNNNNNSNENGLSDEDNDDLSSLVHKRRRTLSVLPRIQLFRGSSDILTTDSQIDELRASFPYRFKNSDWTLLYKLSKDGASYTSFFNCTEKASPVVLLIQTDGLDEKIGAFLSCGLKFSRRYYGNGEIFVFRFTPRCETFKWSQEANQYFVTSTQTEIAIGGGGTSAIWIDGNLLNAISEPCVTFNSPCLTGNTNFKCNEIEVWSLGGEHNGF